MMNKTFFVGLVIISIVAGMPVVYAESDLFSQLNFEEIRIDNISSNGVLFLALNVPLLITSILYKQNILPEKIKNGIRIIFSFEISRKITLTILVIIFVTYIFLASFEFNEVEDFGADTTGVFYAAENISFNLDGNFNSKVKYFLLYSSIEIFDNIKIVPFFASLFLLLISYFITKEITQKRFAGIITVVIILQSTLFLRFDTIATYSNFWVLFYFLSVYLIMKKWYLSKISFVISTLSKPLTAIFLPASIFFVYRSNMTTNQKLISTITYSMIFIAGFIMFTTGKFDVYLHGFAFHEFLTGFKQFSTMLSGDYFIIMGLLPLSVGLFITSRRGNVQADSIQFLILIILLSSPLLIAFSEFNNHDYRMIPFVVAFALGIGALFSNNDSERNPSKISTIIFIVTFVVISINMASVFFPDLIRGTLFLELFR